MISKDADQLSVSSGDRTFVTLSPVPGLVAAGWGFFEVSQFDTALARFSAAYAYEPDNVDVLEGMGWTYLRLYGLDESRAWFEDALALEPDRVDCLAGAAFVYQALELYEDAIEAADDALDLGGETYVFAHASEISSSDIRYCLAVSFVATGDLIGALAEVKLLDPAVTLDPDDPQTWGGQASFEEALLLVIEDLGDEV